jgi:uncharacterized membrane protein YdjX (TVP38/TMEM64 family)
VVSVSEARRLAQAQEPVYAPDRRSLVIRIAAVLLVALLLAAAWRWTSLRELLDLDRMAAWMEPHRWAWYSLPLVLLLFTLLKFLMVPMVVPILATGLAFGPWLGSIYALIGALGSASLGYGVGSIIGPQRLERVAGPRFRRLSEKVKGSGPLAVFLILKTPLPSVIINIALGASGVRYRDFLLGSLLGLLPLVLALDAFEGSLMRVLEQPTPGNVVVATLFLLIPLTLALRINRALKKSRIERASQD